MKLLIIGKSGRLGSQLVKDSIAIGHDVISPSHQELDITNTTQFEQYIMTYKPDIVINTAAFNNLVKAEEQPLEAFKINSIAVKEMAEVLHHLQPESTFITFSTNYVFDGELQRPLDEYDSVNPLQIYGLSKLAGEYASLSYNNSVIIRTSSIFGENSKYGNIVNRIIREEQTKQTNYIEVGNNEVISLTYAKDLSKAILQLIEHKRFRKHLYNIYHLVNEGHCTRYQMTEEIFHDLDIKTEIIPVDRKGRTGRMRRPKFTALENTNAKELGIELPQWEDALRRYLESKYQI
ncbi:MAG: NAD(P)-dependent oxidoreductase [Candidatus Dojkabacteria bacterium]|nr:NAD(P)-dependent oxidoreductase [Candidatus Dojkabacteria bacterium]